MLDFLSFLPIDVITNATNALLTSGSQAIPADQIVSTVASNTGIADTGTGLGATGLTALAVKTFLDTKSKKDRSALIAEAVTRLINDNQDNEKERIKFLDIFKFMLDTAVMNPTISFNDVLKMKYDITSEKTIAQRFVEYIDEQKENYVNYYDKETFIDGLHSKDLLKQANALVKSKTTPA